jgi:acyl-coenzyme A synthetase/AMP-(fatty) acid ligase
VVSGQEAACNRLVNAEHHYLLYTSGSTSKPKGIQH